jgi:hypothetical protein
LEVDVDTVGVVQQRIRELQEQEKEYKQQLKRADVPKKRLVAEANQNLDLSLALFSRLRHSQVKSDFKTLQNCLEKAINRIVVKVSKTKQGRRHCYQLVGGEIYPQLSSPYTSDRSAPGLP